MISAEYPHVSSTVIELLGTVPALFTMLTVGLSPQTAQKIGYKKTVLIGLCLVFASGTLPMVVDSFEGLFVSRVFFGIGIGLFNPLLFSFSSYFYEGKELSSMIGFQSAFEGLGGIVTSLIVAQLIAGGWRQTLWTYVMVVPIVLLFAVFVPDVAPDEKGKERLHPAPLGKDFAIWLGLLLTLVTVYMSASIKMTSLFLEGGYGQAREASVALALIGCGAMIVGFFFGKSKQFLQEWLFPISLLGLATCLGLLSIAWQTWQAFVLSFGLGVCFRTFIPYLMDKANQVSDGSGERRTALLLMVFNTGFAFAPLTIRWFQVLLGLEKVSSLLRAEGAVVGLLAIGAVVYSVRHSIKR